MANEVKFIEITKSSYDSLSVKNDNALYFVKDDNKRYLYKGSNLIAKNYDDIEIIRTRNKTSSLTSVSSGDTIGTITCNNTLSIGDRLLIEVADYSSYLYNPKILGFTVGRNTTNPNTTDDDMIVSWTTFNGTTRTTYSFTVSFSASNLYFGSKRKITETFNGTEINITTGTYNLYVGQIWKLND